MNEDNYQKILKVLEEHKEHSIAFRSDTTSELKQIGRRLDISNGRMAKQEEATQRLREEDIKMSEGLKLIKENGRFVRDRYWTIITSVVSALIISAIISTVVWVINR